MKNYLFVFLIGILKIQAQQTFDASGGDGIGSGGTTNYSFGQVFYTSAIGTNGLINQGVQLPFEITVLETVEAEKSNINVTIYPNPAKEYILLYFENQDFVKFNYQLYDCNGRIFIDNIIHETITNIEMGYLPKATYFLKVSDTGKTVKIFKIIKN